MWRDQGKREPVPWVLEEAGIWGLSSVKPGGPWTVRFGLAPCISWLPFRQRSAAYRTL